MDKKTKKVLAVVVDIILLAVIAAAIYILVFKSGVYSDKKMLQNILYLIIILAIPTIFYISYMSFAGDKFNFDDERYLREFVETDENDNTDETLEKDTKDNNII